MHKKGFTLVELLITVIIIGILASIALPQYRTALEKSRAAEAVSNIGSIRAALDRYWYEHYDLTGVAANLSNLDVTIIEKLYSYEVSGLSGSGADRAYTIIATRTAAGETYTVEWIQSGNDGNLYKSENLGGPTPP